MELRKVTIEKSTTPKLVRLCGEVVYDDNPKEPECYWYDVSEELSESLSDSGNPWLACLLPLAMTLKEPLRLVAPVDATLLKNIKQLMKIWRGWYPKLSEVEIDAGIENAKSQPLKNGRTVLFFSGGIDSFFTLIHCNKTQAYQINELLFILGFDIKTENVSAFNKLNELVQRAADGLNCVLINAATNIKETRLREAKWAELFHGSATASVALALENRYEKALISSTHDFNNISPWGSTPQTDPLLSTSKTEIIHYGADFTRVQKTEEVAKNEIALRTLKVCGNSRSDMNCSNCSKCYRTMINLELIGALNKCPRFSKEKFEIGKISKIYLRDENALSFYSELKMLARSKGRNDIMENIENCIRQSNKLNKRMIFAKYWIAANFFRRGARWLENRILKDSIR
jgi:hypothetical protein